MSVGSRCQWDLSVCGISVSVGSQCLWDLCLWDLSVCGISVSVGSQCLWDLSVCGISVSVAMSDLGVHGYVRTGPATGIDTGIELV